MTKRHSLSVCIWFHEWAHLGPESTVPMHPQLRPFIWQLFFDFGAIFSPNGPSIFGSSRFTKWLFFQNAIQLRPHGGKNHVVLYQEMWLQRRLHVSKLLSAATSQRFSR